MPPVVDWVSLSSQSAMQTSVRLRQRLSTRRRTLREDVLLPVIIDATETVSLVSSRERERSRMPWACVSSAV